MERWSGRDRMRTIGMIRNRITGACAESLLLSGPLEGRSTPQLNSQPIFALDLASTPLDEFPASVKALTGVMTVVDRGGQHMLKASSPSEFLITLPQVLPADFTIELDLIPKGCCAPDDIMLEGTATMNRGPASAQLTWHPERLSAVGGGEMYQAAMPADLAAATPGNLTHVVVEFQGTQIKLYTNGRRLYTLDKQFARGRVLRVWLGGADDASNALYLADFRIGLGAATPGVIAQSQAGLSPGSPGSPSGSGGVGPIPGTQSPSRPDPNNPPPQIKTGGPVPLLLTNVTVRPGALGPIVDWTQIGTSAVYTVERWEADAAGCCNKTSPASPPLTGPTWQDSPPPLTGTYVYRVTGTTSSGTAKGETQFYYLKTGGGQIITERPPTTDTPTSITPPIAGSGGIAPGLTVTVTLGANGPVVSWPLVATATGYGVTRAKIDDPNCCNNNSGRAPLAGSPWQDQPLPLSGTYLYTVTAVTPAG